MPDKEKVIAFANKNDKALGSFAHLHVHTDASLLDGLSPVDQLVSEAQRLGFKALAMTDHGTLANAVSFYLTCQLHGIKPLLGLEGYLAIDGDVGHITLLADGDEGWANLVELNNLGHKSDFKKPAFTLDQLIKHSDNLVLLTGCVSSPFNTMSYDDALHLGRKLLPHFSSRMFAEAMMVSDTDTWTRPLSLAKDLRIKAVITNDVHFPRPEHVSSHQVLTTLKGGFTYHDSKLWLKTGRQVFFEAARRSAGNPEEIVNAIRNAGSISKLIMVPKLQREAILPKLTVSAVNVRSRLLDALKIHITIMVDKGIIALKNAVETLDLYINRMDRELGIIERMGYLPYFVILDDIVSAARERDVRVGPGRGSGAGSLVLFLLGVTDVDPIQYDLPFERFLNPERKGMPDVDIDFEQERRDRVLNYAKTKWQAIPIATYSRFRHKALVRELGKVYKVPIDDTEQASDDTADGPAFKHMAEVAGPEFMTTYNVMLDQISHKGKHAGGVILRSDNVPIERLRDGSLAAAWTEGEHNELSYVGVVKFDLLGLSALSVLRRLEESHDDVRPEDNEWVYKKIFDEGEVEGIFQFEGSPGIRDLVMRLKPRNIEDLAVASALYRPGALDVGSAENYLRWKEEFRPDVPDLFCDILVPTHGAVVFQEQVMAIIAAATGGTLASADSARRVIVKSKAGDPVWEASMATLSRQFIEGAMKKGLKEERAKQWWEELAAHARYSFNKAHAVSYAVISYEMAWWKYSFRSDFYAELLNVDSSDAQRVIIVAASEGIKIGTPHVNRSGTEYTTHHGEIHLPLTAVKYLGEAGAKTIIENRPPSTGYTSLEQFMHLVPRKLVRANARAGLFFTNGFLGVNPAKADGDEVTILQLSEKSMPEEVASSSSRMMSYHRKYLGFVIPTRAILEKIHDWKENGYESGIIIGSHAKESTYGTYMVFTLSPNGSFWLRIEGNEAQIEAMKEGRVVAVKKLTSGRAKKVYFLDTKALETP